MFFGKKFLDSCDKAENTMKETFGQRLSRLRKEKGLTQEEIANQITISPQAVSKWENDISSPDILVLGNLADILGVSVDELLGRDSQEEKPEVQKEPVKEEPKEEKKSEIQGKHKSYLKIKNDKVSLIVTPILFGLALIGYVLMGVLWKEKMMGWAMGWILFLIPIIVGSLISAIQDRSFTKFAYPLLVVAVYCTLGYLGTYFEFPGWQTYWFLFITIPAYYAIFGAIDKFVIKNRDMEDKKEED